MTKISIPAGEDQTIAVYTSDDTGTEIDPPRLLAEIALDASQRDRDGMRIVSTAAVPRRNAGLFLGRHGSGVETKVSIVVVCARSAR